MLQSHVNNLRAVRSLWKLRHNYCKNVKETFLAFLDTNNTLKKTLENCILKQYK